MPERIYAILGYPDEQRERVQRMFLDAGLIDELVQPRTRELYRIELPSEEAALRLTAAARLHDLAPPHIQRTFAATPRELAACELLVLSAGGPGANNGPPRTGTDYDETTACPDCGAGLTQTSPLVVRASELPKGRTTTACSIGDDLLLHDSVAKPMEQAGLMGIGFRPVLGRDGNPNAWRQMVVAQTLPPMLASARGMIRGRIRGERPCTRCGRDGWFNSTTDPFIPAYARAVLGTIRDAAWTYELFSTGAWAHPIHGKRSLARRTLIVRPAVYRLLKSLKARGIRASPVQVA